MTYIQIILLYLLILSAISSSIPVTLSNSTTSINYNSDIASCACDITIGLCDNYCCCDSICSSDTISGWKDLCLYSSVSTAEVMCSQIGYQQFSSFEDLGCVYISNRGQIGDFHPQLDTSNIVYPSLTKLAFKNTNVPSKIPSITSTNYSSTSSLKIFASSTIQLLTILRSGFNSKCVSDTVMINSSQSSSCQQLANTANCPNLNSYLPSSFQVCLNGDCSNLSSISYTITPSTLPPNNSCQNVITQLSITITLSSTQSVYNIASFTISAINQSIDVTTPKFFTLKTIITIIKATNNQKSGNPGYQTGKPILSSVNNPFILTPFLDPTNNNKCITSTTTSTTANLNILWNQNYVSTCQFTSNPCSVALKIDTIFANNLTFIKYATANETITISSIPQTTLCGKEVIIINMIYSSAGWLEDPQYYLVSVSITTRNPTITSFTTKTLMINWIYVDQQSVTQPTQSKFYQYWNRLWMPLQNRVNIYLYSNIVWLGLAMILVLMII